MKNRAVSEVIGTLILVGVVMIGIVLVGLLLLSNPAPSKVPVFDSIISNRSKTIYIYHKGGDPLFAGQYKIFVDGVDQTSIFTIMSPGTEPWSVGETLTGTLTTMPRHVAIILNQSGGGASVITESDLNPILTLPAPVPNPPSMAWSNSPAFGNATTSFTFTDSSTGPYINAYFWDFNDANTSTLQSPAHVFPGTTAEYYQYSINHSATDSGGTFWARTSWLNRSSWVTVYKNLTPTISFTQDTTSGAIPLTVAFTATPAGAIQVDSWSWDFGDSHTSTSQNPSNTYTSTGTYPVSLTATNYTLGQTTVTKASLITAYPPPSVAWSSSPAFGNATTSFTFTDSSTGTNINAYFWDFNDGNTTTQQSYANKQFPATTAEYYQYNINHSATDSAGTGWAKTSWLNRSSWVTIYKNLTPTTNFTQDKTTGIIPLIVTFTANQVGAIKNDIWSWDFGDSTSTPNPHTYSTAGTYTVSLTATNYTLGVSPPFTNLVKACPVPTPTWKDYNWLYRKNITIDKTKVAATLSNFPVLIKYTDSDLKGRTQNEILFTTSDGQTKLSHQIESFDSGTGALVAWVKVPNLPTSPNTSLFMYYGGPTAPSQEYPTDVWTNSFTGVYHLNETTDASLGDSTGTGPTGNPTNSPAQTAGQIDGSLQFVATSNQRVSMQDNFDFSTNPFTASAWVKGGGENQQVLGKSNWAGTDLGIQIFTNSSAYVTNRSTYGLSATGSNANYPKYYSGDTTTVQGTSRGTSGQVDWYRQTGTIKGTVTNINLYIRINGGNVRVALYADQGGTGQKPGALLVESASYAINNAFTWESIPVPATYIDASAWWIAIQVDTTGSRYRSNAVGSNSYAVQTSYTYGAFPGTGGSSTVTAGRSLVSAYATYVQIMNFAKATKAVLNDNNAVIESVSFYSHSTGNVRLAIYSDPPTAANSLKWDSGGSTAVTASSWNTVRIASGSPNSLTLNSGTYWLAWQWDSTNSGPSHTAGSSGDGYNMTLTYGSFPSSWTGTSIKEKWSMFASYSLKIGTYDSNWHYLTVARTGTGANGLTTYYDGSPVATGTDARSLSNGNNFLLARAAGTPTSYFNGYIDEVRLSSVARDANWILTEYRNQANPALFHYNMTQEAWGTC